MTDQQLPGMEADTRLTVVGVRVDVADSFALGEPVKLTVHGHVILVGEELLEKEGRRTVVKIRADQIEVS